MRKARGWTDAASCHVFVVSANTVLCMARMRTEGALSEGPVLGNVFLKHAFFHQVHKYAPFFCFVWNYTVHTIIPVYIIEQINISRMQVKLKTGFCFWISPKCFRGNPCQSERGDPIVGVCKIMYVEEGGWRVPFEFMMWYVTEVWKDGIALGWIRASRGKHVVAFTLPAR